VAAGVRHRYRVWFSKTGPLRFISHHDLMRVFQRAVRRAGIPVRFSQGFNPRPRISYLAPLPVYHEGLRELLVIDLQVPLPPSQLQTQLAAQLPPGLEIVGVEEIPANKRTRVSHFLYALHLPSPAQIDLSRASLDDLLIQRERKDGTAQSIRVGDYLRDISFQPDTIRIKLEVTEGRTIRPEELLRALNIFPHGTPEYPRIVRDAVEVED